MKKPWYCSFLAVLILLAGNFPSFAGDLPYSKIKDLYKEGEFEQIRVSLENFLKKSGKDAEPKERIFAYKYLGVIYAAEPEGYPLAETYFYQLLKLAPKAHLSDMYVSSAIEDVFAKTQARYQKENRNNLEYDEFGNPRNSADTGSTVALAKGSSNQPLGPLKTDPAPPRRKSPGKKSSIRVWPWVLSAGVALAVGGIFWFANQDKGKKEFLINGGKV